jgi:hypothetical protein
MRSIVSFITAFTVLYIQCIQIAPFVAYFIYPMYSPPADIICARLRTVLSCACHAFAKRQNSRQAQAEPHLYAIIMDSIQMASDGTRGGELHSDRNCIAITFRLHRPEITLQIIG